MITINVHKALQSIDGLMDLNLRLQIENGQFITLYGESGAGKTSTLRMLSGLMNPDTGTIQVNGKTWFDSNTKTNLTPQLRNIGFVFQDYALFPNMTVRQNLEFALKKSQDKQIVSDLIDIVGLGALQNRMPDTLSGGQKQRAALARSLVQQPDILLLDEPFAALDIQIRLKLQDYLLNVHQEYGLTTILISHDVGEIMKLSDRVFVLERGKVIQEGTPEDVFMNHEVSGKFKFVGDVLAIEKEEVVFVVSIRIQSSVVKVIAQESDIKALKIGDKVVVASKAFNPILYKLDAS